MPSSDSTAALAGQERLPIAGEDARRPPSAWSKCITIGLVNGGPAIVPLSETYIEWLDHHFPDGPSR